MSKYPNVSEWIVNNIILGDTKHLFLSFIDKKSLKLAANKTAEYLFKKLNENEEMNSRFIWNCIIKISPFPGFVNDARELDYICNPLDISFRDLFIALEKDGGKNANHYAKIYWPNEWEEVMNE